MISTSAGQAPASKLGVVAGADALGERRLRVVDRRRRGARSSSCRSRRVVVGAEPHLALDEVGEVAGDADLVLEVRRDGAEDLVVEQTADRREEVRGVWEELHGRNARRRRRPGPCTLSTPFGACWLMKPNM